MKILVKYPSRSRPEQFLKTLETWTDRIGIDHEVAFLISVDKDDESMTDKVLFSAERLQPNIRIVKGLSSSKIDACNRDIKNYSSYFHWDILLLISDDMVCVTDYWDNIIRGDFKDSLDKVVWYHDGSPQKSISTMACMGRNYYDKFGYIYHPSYKSFFCDNEFTEVAIRDNKILKRLEITLAEHQHPQWGDGKLDLLYAENSKHWEEDSLNYSLRRSGNYV